MRFPSFEPSGEPIRPIEPEKKSGLANIPQAARKKILRVLQKDLLKRGGAMSEDLRQDTLHKVINLEEYATEETHGALITPDNLHFSRKGTEKDIAGPWSDTISLEERAANESNLEEDKRLA